MSLQDEISKRIKEEINNDPHAIGYAGKTDDEIQVLLNNAEVKQRIVEDVFPSPINRIMSGLAGTQNVVTIKEVSDAKAFIDPVIP